jgi:hypothetical protein
MNGRTGAPGDEQNQLPLFPHERTFIVRFDRTTDLAAGRCVGKLEVVATSDRHSFADLAGLIEQFRMLIDGSEESWPQEPAPSPAK